MVNFGRPWSEMKYCTNGVLEAQNPEPLLNSTNEQCTNKWQKGKKFRVFAENDFHRDIGRSDILSY